MQDHCRVKPPRNIRTEQRAAEGPRHRVNTRMESRTTVGSSHHGNTIGTYSIPKERRPGGDQCGPKAQRAYVGQAGSTTVMYHTRIRRY